MTRKKGVALIICLTLIISMALPGTLAVSTDQAGTNDNVTFTSGNDQPPPSAPESQQQGQQEEQHEPENPIIPENPTEGEQACTCGSTDSTHAETCPLYIAPVCTCVPQPGEGEPHRAGCAFYTSVMGTTAAAEEPTTEEATVDITYVAVGPAGASFGSVDPASETVKVESGTAVGSTPTPGTGFKFVGWFKDQTCTLPVDATWIGNNNKITPQKTPEAYEAATYYAKFDYDVANLTINKTGCQDIDENQSFIFDVTSPNGYSKRVVIKGTDSVTITGLKVGEYTVTEVTSWSWRYTTGGSQIITLQGSQTGAVSFTNNVSNSKWLSGNAYSKIVFGNK